MFRKVLEYGLVYRIWCIGEYLFEMYSYIVFNYHFLVKPTPAIMPNGDADISVNKQAKLATEEAFSRMWGLAHTISVVSYIQGFL